jgi:hypothetical protein
VVLHGPEIRAYREYYKGRSYHGPHRHHHDVYDFPVYRHGAYVHEPHVYCGGHLVESHVSYRGPRVSFSFAF